MPEVTIDFITFDRKSGEYTLRLVESIDWNDPSVSRTTELRRIQTRIYDTLDTLIGGAFLKKYPEAKGFGLCVQIDSPFGEPPELNRLIHDMARHITEDNDFGRAIRKLPHAFFHIASAHDRGRYQDGKS